MNAGGAVSATFSISGLIVEGDVITVLEYLKIFEGLIRQGFGDSNQKVADYLAEVVEGLEQKNDKRPDDTPRQAGVRSIHLKNVVIHQGGETFLQDLWATSTANVDGFMWGRGNEIE